jgi:hypothetical protein
VETIVTTSALSPAYDDRARDVPMSLDATGALRVAAGVGGGLSVLQVRGAIASASLTRPLDTVAYASGDLLANSITPGSVIPLAFTLTGTPLGGVAEIKRIRVRKTSATAGTFRVFLFQTSPVSVVGDNTSFNSNAAGFFAALDIPMNFPFSDANVGFLSLAASPALVQCTAGTNIIYGLLAVQTAYTPTSGEVFTVELEYIYGP